jgi:ParB family chromosome partitioning protein
MAGDKKRSQLGRGLAALLGEDSGDYAELDKLRVSRVVPIEFVHPGAFQPRHRADDEHIQSLAQSIRDRGILQPILVRRHPEHANAFEIVAGERRWRAAQQAQLHEIPVVVKDFSDRDVLEIALVENLQRQDLSPLEEAEGYSRLLKEFDQTQTNLARAVGKSRSYVANMVRLLALPDSVKELVDGGALTAGHARALLNAENPDTLARQVVRQGLNVRQTEKLAQSKGVRTRARRHVAEKDADTLSLERDLTNLLGLKVEIKFRGGGGALIIHYGSLDQLDDILHRLSHEPHGAGPPGAGPDPAEATDGVAADAPGPAPETAAEAPSEPEIPEDSEDSGGPVGEGAEGADESPSAAGGEEPAGETGETADEPPAGGPEADRPDDPTATDKPD